jgi:hypothetical protein
MKEFGGIPVIRNEHVYKEYLLKLNADYAPLTVAALSADWFGQEPRWVPDPRRYRRLIHFLLGKPPPMIRKLPNKYGRKYGYYSPANR